MGSKLHLIEQSIPCPHNTGPQFYSVAILVSGIILTARIVLTKTN